MLDDLARTAECPLMSWAQIFVTEHNTFSELHLVNELGRRRYEVTIHAAFRDSSFQVSLKILTV